MFVPDWHFIFNNTGISTEHRAHTTQSKKCNYQLDFCHWNHIMEFSVTKLVDAAYDRLKKAYKRVAY